MSASTSKTLTTIPRASILGTINDFIISDGLTVPITKYSSSFTHVYSIWVAGKRIKYEEGIKDSFKITFTQSKLKTIYEALPNAEVGVFTVYLDTYSGSTKIGSSPSKTAKGTIPSGIKPSCSVSITDEMGYADTFGDYVQGQSKLKIVVTASGSYGSTIKSYKTTADGKTYTKASFTTDAISGKGTLTISATVTDSRERSGTAKVTVDVLPYSLPQVSALNCFRCDAEGNANSNGEYLAIVFDSAITPLNNKNSATYELQYKKATADEYTTTALTAFSGQYSVSGGLFVLSADKSSSYNITLTVADSFTSAKKTGTGASIKKQFSILKSVFGFAIGKVAELGGVFDLALQTRFTGGILQPVLEANTDFDDLKLPNTYTLKNTNSANYANCPLLSGTGTLKIETCGEDGQLKQTVEICNKTDPNVYTRFYYQGAWGDWIRQFEVALYNDSSGSDGTITLSESVENFEYIEVFYTDNNNKVGGSVRVYNPQGKTLSLSTIEGSTATKTYFRRTIYLVSGTTITPDMTTASYVLIDNGTPSHKTTGGTNYIKIYRVVGFERGFM